MSGTSSKDENALQFESFQSNDSAFDCCGFLPRFFDKVRKVEKGEQIVVAANTKPEFNSLSLAFIKKPTNRFFQLSSTPAYQKWQLFKESSLQNLERVSHKSFSRQFRKRIGKFIGLIYKL